METSRSVPGLMRLGLAGASPARSHPGFRFDLTTSGLVVAFDKNAPVTRSAADTTGGASAAAASAAEGGAGASASPRKFATRGGGGPGTEAFVPAKYALAGQRLTFKGYFQEGVPESALETSRKRQLIVSYYLEDDTTEIVQAGARNDGLPHGRFLKRMKLPGVSVETLRVGGIIEVFSRSIRLDGCDEFTRKFYAGLGSPQAADEAFEKDAWTTQQDAAFARNDPTVYHGVKSSAITRFIEAARGSQRTASFKKDVKGRFLAYDGIVLRFLVQWDDTKGNNAFGEKMMYWLSFHLASEEVEIQEVKGKKTVIASSSHLLSRARLPKTIIAHDDRMRSCEDVTGDEDYYHEDDFVVGGTVSVFARTMLLCDCDAFTQKWYLENKGIDQQANRIVIEPPVVPRSPVTVPPHTGFGSEEDTLASWKSLIPRKPRTDLAKLHEGTGASRKFMAHLVTTDPINAERLFRITVFVDDNEVAVFEPKVRNSGVLGGVWMKKQRLRNPETGEYFKMADFVVGRDVTINAHLMNIFEEERQPAEAVADVAAIILCLKKKLGEASHSLRKMFRKFDLDKSQTISYDEFVNMLHHYGLGITKYEAITLFKAFEGPAGFMSYETFMVAFDRAADNVVVKTTLAAETSRAITAKHSLEELDAMIDEAREHAKTAKYLIEQEVFVARIARSLKNSRTAQAVHDNFRRFDVNKDHMISVDEFYASMRRVLNLTDKEIAILVGVFYPPGAESLNYDHFMGIVHTYADKTVRSS